MSRDSLRQRLRAVRRALTPAERRQAADKAAAILTGLPQFHAARRIAAYVAMDGELDPAPLIAAARAAGKQVYLPALPPDDQGPLAFQLYVADTRLVPNRLRILEPDAPLTAAISATELDLVLAPLVGFDMSGRRLGMGGGFYDRTFAFLKDGRITQPLLIGLAYECQRVTELDEASWDVPLKAVVTEQQFYAIT
jgi:5-formyltetrahydrofolate cyclo-ligase